MHVNDKKTDDSKRRLSVDMFDVTEFTKKPRADSSDGLMDLADFFGTLPTEPVMISTPTDLGDPALYLTDTTPDHCLIMAKTLEEMARRGEGCDLVININEDEITMHVCYAMAASPVLKRLLASRSASVDSDSIGHWLDEDIISDTALELVSKGHPTVIRVVDAQLLHAGLWSAVRQYIYTGILNFNNESEYGILRCALRLSIKPLVVLCVNRIASSLNSESSLAVLSFALEVDLPELQIRAFNYIDLHFDSIISDYNHEWCLLDSKVIQNVINRDTLYTRSEVLVFRAIADWTMYDSKPRMNSFTQWVSDSSSIRLSNMTREELIEMSQHSLVSSSKLLRRAMYDEAMIRVEPSANRPTPASRPRRYEPSFINRSPQGDPAFSVTHCERTISQHDRAVCALVVYNEYIITGSADSKIRVFNTGTWSLQCILEGHTQAVVTLKLVGDDRLISACPDKTIRIWSLLTWNCIRVLPSAKSSVCSLAILGDKLVSGADDGCLKTWGIGNWSLHRTVHGHSHVIWALASYGQDIVVSGSSDTTIKVWQVDKNGFNLVTTLTGHRDEVQALTIDVQRDWLFSGSDDGTIKIHECSNWQCIRTLQWSNRAVLSLVSYGGNLVAGLGNGAISIWELDRIMHQDAATNTLKDHTSCVMALGIFRSKLVSVSYDRTLKIWA